MVLSFQVKIRKRMKESDNLPTSRSKSKHTAFSNKDATLDEQSTHRFRPPPRRSGRSRKTPETYLILTHLQEDKKTKKLSSSSNTYHMF